MTPQPGLWSDTSLKHPRARTRRAVASDLRRLDGQVKALDKQLAAGVKAGATGLTDLYGLGPVLAARILGRVGDISRFLSAAHFASCCGTACPT